MPSLCVADSLIGAAFLLITSACIYGIIQARWARSQDHASHTPAVPIHQCQHEDCHEQPVKCCGKGCRNTIVEFAPERAKTEHGKACAGGSARGDDTSSEAEDEAQKVKRDGHMNVGEKVDIEVCVAT